MILLDTNVLSELMRPEPDTGVVQWLNDLAADEVWISTITVAEIQLGIALLPDGKRRAILSGLAKQMFEDEFLGRCLPFDIFAAHAYSEIVVSRTRQGRPISVEDAQIAAIAQVGSLCLATRNIRDFEGIEHLDLVNPWLSTDSGR